MLAFITFAAEAVGEEESSKALFYIAGLVLVGWALAVSLFGMSRHDDWPSERAKKPLIGVSAVLVIFACAAAVITG